MQQKGPSRFVIYNLVNVLDKVSSLSATFKGHLAASMDDLTCADLDIELIKTVLILKGQVAAEFFLYTKERLFCLTTRRVSLVESPEQACVERYIKE